MAGVNPVLTVELVPAPDAVLSSGAGESPENSLMLIPLVVLELGNVQVIVSPNTSAATLCADTTADLGTPPPPAATFWL